TILRYWIRWRNVMFDRFSCPPKLKSTAIADQGPLLLRWFSGRFIENRVLTSKAMYQKKKANASHDAKLIYCVKIKDTHQTEAKRRKCYIFYESVTTLCTADEFACIVSEQCIDLRRRCNGIAECSDGTDEIYCDVCGNGLFHCAKSGECIPSEERCDGKRQCPHGEDEMLCKKSPDKRVFTCQSRTEEIPIVQLCDGVPQCSDGSDEMYCEPAGSPAEASIVFSSNPYPAVGPSEYEYEESATEDDKPSFPMLSMTLPPVIPV
ncbi:Low-density lipoprotein receptor domain class A, partial [Teladorsagia circumcincta]